MKNNDNVIENDHKIEDELYSVTTYQSSYHDSWIRCKALSYLYSQFNDQISNQKDSYSEDDGYDKVLELVALTEGETVIGILDIGIYTDERNEYDPYVEHLKKGSYMDVLAVHPDYQGQGVAQKLLRVAFEQLKKDGVEYTTIFTRSDQAANRLYKKMGAQLIATDYRVKGRLKETIQDIGSFRVDHSQQRIKVKDSDGQEVSYMYDCGYYWVYDEKYLDLFDIEECVLEHSYFVCL